VATPETEERLLAVGRAGTAEHVQRIVRGWRRMDAKAEAREANLQHAGRSLQVYPDEDGTVRVRGRLTPEVGALLLKALAAARESLYRRRREQGPDLDPPTRWSSSRRTPWRCWPRALCTRSLTRARPASATRWWCTWTPRCWQTPRRRASRSWKVGCASQLERRNAWRATPAGW
jgi:hypothetical protein